MCVRLLVCCRRSRIEMQRGLGPPGSAQPRLVSFLASTRPSAEQCSRTTEQLVGRRLWTRPTQTAPVFWLREVGFPRPNSLRRHAEPSLQALATHLNGTNGQPRLSPDSTGGGDGRWPSGSGLDCCLDPALTTSRLHFRFSALITAQTTGSNCYDKSCPS